MTTQRFDIEVRDLVAKSIRTELLGIGAAAVSAFTSLRDLRTEMASLTNAGRSTTTASNQTVSAMRAQAQAAQDAASALAQQRAEAERLTQALKDQAQAARDAAGAGGGGGAPPSPSPSGRGGGSSGPRPYGGGSQTADDFRDVAGGAQLAAHHLANLSFQLNDVVVGFASGQKPMTIFIQQGAQIAQIAQMSGVGFKGMVVGLLSYIGAFKTVTAETEAAALATAMARAANIDSAAAMAAANIAAIETEIALARAEAQVATTASAAAAAQTRLTAATAQLAEAQGIAAVTSQAQATAQAELSAAQSAASAATTTRITALGTSLIVVTALLAGATAATAALNREASDDGLKKYTKEMGYTASEVKKLNAVTVTMGDTAKAVFQVGFERIAGAFGVSSKDIKRYWENTLDFLASATRVVVAGIYSSFAGMSEGVKIIIKNLGDGKDNDNPIRNMMAGYAKAYKDAQSFMDDVVKQSEKNARARQDAMAAEMKGDTGGGKKKGGGWDRADEWRKANEELDRQISLLQYYGDELERNTQLEQIAREFADHKQPLNEAERAHLAEKIRLLQEGRRVQEAMTAADEAANGPLRDLTATTEALNKLLDAGAISWQEYARQLAMAQRAYEDATNPLAAMNRELEKNGRLIGLYGKDRAQADYFEQIRARLEAQGQSPWDEQTGTVGPDGTIQVGAPKIRDDVQILMDKYKKQQEQADMATAFGAIDSKNREDPTDPSYILDHHREMYEELERLREEDVISEEEAARRKGELDRAYLDARLENASTVLGRLSELQRSKSKEVAAIGKAAAIAQATIDGYRAVQAALAGPPGPPWSYAIAAATGAAAVANVARIAGVGFMVGGYTGDGAANQRAGDVHRGEYVFDAAATKRIGVPALEAMRKGSTLSQPANENNAGGPRVVIKPQPGVYVEERRTSTGEIELIAERVARKVAPQAVADDLKGNANGKVSSAMQQTMGVRRQR